MRVKRFKDAKDFMRYVRDATEIDHHFLELVFKVYGSSLSHRPLSVPQFLSSGHEAENLVHLKSRFVTDIVAHGMRRLETALKPQVARQEYNDTPVFTQQDRQSEREPVLSEGQSEIGILSGVMSDFFSTDRNIFRSESRSRSNDSCPSTGNFSRRAGNNLHDSGIQEISRPKEGEQINQLKQ